MKAMLQWSAKDRDSGFRLSRPRLEDLGLRGLGVR